MTQKSDRGEAGFERGHDTMQLFGRLLGRKRISGVQGLVTQCDSHGSGRLIRTWLRDHFDAHSSSAVPVGRKHRAPDPDLLNSFLGWQFSLDEAIDLDLCARAS